MISCSKLVQRFIHLTLFNLIIILLFLFRKVLLKLHDLLSFFFAQLTRGSLCNSVWLRFYCCWSFYGLRRLLLHLHAFLFFLLGILNRFLHLSLFDSFSSSSGCRNSFDGFFRGCFLRMGIRLGFCPNCNISFLFWFLCLFGLFLLLFLSFIIANHLFAARNVSLRFPGKILLIIVTLPFDEVLHLSATHSLVHDLFHNVLLLFSAHLK